MKGAKHIISKPRISARRAFLLFLPLAVALAGGVFSSSLRLSQTVADACTAVDSTGEVNKNDTTAFFEGQTIQVPKEIFAMLESDAGSRVLASVSGDERWIEVDLSEQKIRAWEGDKLFLESLVSTGLPWWPTPTGEFRIWTKFRATKMEGGSGKYYYYLPNVPYVMFFENASVPGHRGYSLHGTYWHNDFGKVHSHGCVNLPTPIAQQLFYWTGPSATEDTRAVRANSENEGTRIVVHD